MPAAKIAAGPPPSSTMANARYFLWLNQWPRPIMMNPPRLIIATRPELGIQLCT